jgi:carboxypeptidase Q
MCTVPRLTNSPNYKKAADYAKGSLEKWGLVNAQIDTWDEMFGRGWQLKKFSMQVISPSAAPLIAHPKAWSPGIKGTVLADVVYLDVKTEADLAKYKGKLKGKIVLFSLPTPIKPGFKADASRLDRFNLVGYVELGRPGSLYWKGPFRRRNSSTEFHVHEVGPLPERGCCCCT